MSEYEARAFEAVTAMPKPHDGIGGHISGCPKNQGAVLKCNCGTSAKILRVAALLREVAEEAEKRGRRDGWWLCSIGQGAAVAEDAQVVMFTRPEGKRVEPVGRHGSQWEPSE